MAKKRAAEPEEVQLKKKIVAKRTIHDNPKETVPSDRSGSD